MAARDLDQTWIVNLAIGPGSAHQVPTVSLPHHYRAGWSRLADEDIPQPDTEGDPEPLATPGKTGGRRRSSGGQQGGDGQAGDAGDSNGSEDPQ